MYAVLALSSLHRSGSQHALPSVDASLGHYTTAVGQISSKLSSSPADSRLVALIACVTFISFGFLSGRFEEALDHLRSGLRILRESPFVHVRDDRVTLLAIASAAEEDVFRAIARHNLLARLFANTNRCSDVSFHWHDETPSSLHFADMESAWIPLEAIMNDILHLGRKTAGGSHSADLVSKLALDQRQIHSRLGKWLSEYEKLTPDEDSSMRHRVLYHLLHMWFDMASIMTSTAQHSNNLVFEEHLAPFESITKHGTISRSLRSGETPAGPMRFHMLHSLVDVGWIPPLYYTAINCRSQSVRMRAVELIESSAHREGIWDSKMAAATAKKVGDSVHGVGCGL